MKIDSRTSAALAAFADFAAHATPVVPPPRHRTTKHAARPVYPVWPTSTVELARLLASRS